MSAACNRLWELDEHRAHMGSSVVIDLQGTVRINAVKDNAGRNLFKHVDDALISLPTYKS